LGRVSWCYGFMIFHFSLSFSMISFHLLLLVWYLRLRQLTSLETCLHIPNVLLIGPWLSMSNLRHYFFGVFELVTVPGLRR
jgi:hypothetical protein